MNRAVFRVLRKKFALQTRVLPRLAKRCYNFAEEFSNMPKKKKLQENQTTNGVRDYSHLPRARDFKLPKKISPELKELMEATREAMEALRLEEEKYGKVSRF